MVISLQDVKEHKKSTASQTLSCLIDGAKISTIYRINRQYIGSTTGSTAGIRRA